MYLNSANRRQSLASYAHLIKLMNNNANRYMTFYIASIVSHMTLLVYTFGWMESGGHLVVFIKLFKTLGNWERV